MLWNFNYVITPRNLREKPESTPPPKKIKQANKQISMTKPRPNKYKAPNQPTKKPPPKIPKQTKTKKSTKKPHPTKTTKNESRMDIKKRVNQGQIGGKKCFHGISYGISKSR